jgi:hypothetical protein
MDFSQNTGIILEHTGGTCLKFAEVLGKIRFCGPDLDGFLYPKPGGAQPHAPKKITAIPVCKNVKICAPYNGKTPLFDV